MVLQFKGEIDMGAKVMELCMTMPSTSSHSLSLHRMVWLTISSLRWIVQ
jgi:hypothetical protein